MIVENMIEMLCYVMWMNLFNILSPEKAMSIRKISVQQQIALKEMIPYSNNEMKGGNMWKEIHIKRNFTLLRITLDNDKKT